MASETAEPPKSAFSEEEKKEILSHPFFARSAEEMEGNPAYEALRCLKYESEDPNANAESFKEEGNFYVQRKEFEKAVTAYTGGILAKPSDDNLLAVLYTNRGIANGLMKNHGSCTKDCMRALRHNPNHLKAYIQAAKSFLILSKPADALQICEAGLKVAADNDTLANLKEKASDLQATLSAKEEMKDRAIKGSCTKLSAICKQLMARGLTIDFEQPPVGLPDHAGVAITIDHMNFIHWPVLFMYPEFSQTDFVRDVAEYLTVRECLSHVLNPSDPPPWDKERAYASLEDDLEIYFETSNQSANRMVKLPIARTITDLTRSPGFYVRRDLVIVLFVVSKLSKQFHNAWMKSLKD